MKKLLIDFLNETGCMDKETFTVLKDNGYFPDFTINKILDIYQGYLNNKYDFEEMMEILFEEESTFRYLCFSGYGNVIYTLTFDEFIDEFVNSEYAEIIINKNGLSKKEIVTKYIDEYFLNGNDLCSFMLGNDIVVVDEEEKRF